MGFRPEVLTALCVMLCSAYWLTWLSGSPLNTKLSLALLSVPPQSQVEPQAKPGWNKALDACSLLTGKEISTILGEPLQGLKPSAHASGKLHMSQCVFITQDFAKSASLAVATPGMEDSGARDLRAFWHNQFHSPHKREHEEGRPAAIHTPEKSAFSDSHQASAKEEVFERGPLTAEPQDDSEDSAHAPRPISSLGEEAYWVGGPLFGALYVLQGDLFLRISVGGVPKESARIAKSKSLATAILARLQQSPID